MEMQELGGSLTKTEEKSPRITDDVGNGGNYKRSDGEEGKSDGIGKVNVDGRKEKSDGIGEEDVDGMKGKSDGIGKENDGIKEKSCVIKEENVDNGKQMQSEGITGEMVDGKIKQADGIKKENVDDGKKKQSDGIKKEIIDDRKKKQSDGIKEDNVDDGKKQSDGIDEVEGKKVQSNKIKEENVDGGNKDEIEGENIEGKIEKSHGIKEENVADGKKDGIEEENVGAKKEKSHGIKEENVDVGKKEQSDRIGDGIEKKIVGDGKNQEKINDNEKQSADLRNVEHTDNQKRNNENMIASGTSANVVLKRKHGEEKKGKNSKFFQRRKSSTVKEICSLFNLQQSTVTKDNISKLRNSKEMTKPENDEVLDVPDRIPLESAITKDTISKLRGEMVKPESGEVLDVPNRIIPETVKAVVLQVIEGINKDASNPNSESLAIGQGHGEIIEGHGEIIEGHGNMSEGRGKISENHGEIIEGHGKNTERHGKISEGHREINKVHGEISEGHGEISEGPGKISEGHGKNSEGYLEIGEGHEKNSEGNEEIVEGNELTPIKPDGTVGFTNILHQAFQKVIKRGFEFNLMVVGESGLGKSTLINSMFLTDIYDLSDLAPKKRLEKTVSIETKTVLLKEDGINLCLTIIDTPGFGDAIDNSKSCDPITHYIEARFEDFLKSESEPIRKKIRDGRVHCCLYFIQPTGHGLKPLDVEFMKKLCGKINVIPVIGKADALTSDECVLFKKEIMKEIMANGIEIYDFPHVDEVNRSLQERMPFAVVGSNTVMEVNGRMLRGRKYPWGFAEVENLDHNDFLALRTMMISTHLEDLKDVTSNVHYEGYRLTKMECTKKEESDLEVEDFREKEARLREDEDKLRRRLEMARGHIQEQLRELEGKRKEFEKEKDMWERQSQDALEEKNRMTLDVQELQKEKNKKKKKRFFQK